MNQHIVTITDGVVTIKYNEYVFIPNGNESYLQLKHVGHNIEFGSIGGEHWTCHDCLEYWDQFSDELYWEHQSVPVLDGEKGLSELDIDREDDEAEYRAERQAEYNAENNIGGFDQDDFYNPDGIY